MDKLKKIDVDWFEYSKDYIKTKFNSDDSLPLNKQQAIKILQYDCNY